MLSRESHLVRYAGAPLESSKRYVWRVKIWDEQGSESPWAEAFFETSLLGTSEWQAVFISADGEDAGASSAGTLLRARPGNISGVDFAPVKGGAAAILGSGTYSFAYPWEE